MANASIAVTSGGCGAICADVLAELPTWFGIEETNADYVAAAENQETLVAYDGDGRALGLLTLTNHSDHAAEIHLIAVRRALHRAGIGRRLVEAAERLLRERGVEFLQVKTLSPSAHDEGYERTRAFYTSRGFRWLEEFPTLWDPSNPALQMIKSLA